MQAPMPTRLAISTFELLCEQGPSFEWCVRGVEIDEGINRRYRALVELECAAEDPAIADFLGCSCELLFLREAESRRLFGIVARAEHLDASFGHERVRLTLVPALALLDQGSHSRIFQEQSVQDILTAVLEPALATCERQLELGSISRGSATRDYCVQYRESDGGFASRLLAEEGISFTFEHREGDRAEVLVLRDSNDQYPEYVGFDGSSEIPVIPERAEEAELESIQLLGTRRALTLTKVMRRDFDWLLPSELLTAETGDADAEGRTRRHYLHGQRRYIQDDQAERIADLLEADSLEALVLCGRSNATALVPGLRFSITHPTTPSLDGEYLLTRVVHRASLGHTGAEGEHYFNEFECVPIAAPMRPRLPAPAPRVPGPQTATVVGDEPIHTDEHGRVQIQLHWEETPSWATDASCWVRCAQSWSGPGWGAQFIPRVGMEVVVEFLEGNPDRPLITGCVYNGDNSPPFLLPDDKTQSGWRTSSVPGGEGYNMLRFEDAAGSEEIHIHGQKDWTIVIENDKDEDIRHDRSKHVGNDERATIDHDRSVSVANNHDETVGVDQNVNIGCNQTVTIGAAASETVAASKTVTVGGAYARTVGGAAAISVAGGSVETVGASRSVVVDGSCSHTVAETWSRVAKQLDEDVETDKTTTVGEKLRMSAGKDFGLEAKKKGLVDAGDQLVLSCGKASITLKKNGDIKIEGKTIEIKGKGDIKIKGKKVANN